MALVAMASAAAQTAPKWAPHIDLEGKLGNDRDLGEADVFMPLWQNDKTLLFGNFRGRMDDNASREGNFGLALRQMLDSGWNLGAYGYFDRRKTENHNYFNQTTFGVEALSLDWDLRANAYTPFGDRVKTLPGSGGGASTASFAGASVVVTTTAVTQSEEQSLAGFDAEIGWRVPVFSRDAGQQLRVFGGAYRFYAEGVDPVQGPRARAELTFDEVPGLWSGSRLTLGGEIQSDGPRGTTGFASARLRIPLQIFGEAASKLTPMERRMADPIVRDIDIVAQTRTATVSPATTETATQTSGGSALTVLTTDTNADGNLSNELTTAGNNSTVIISGTINTTANSQLRTGQTITGSGTLTVQTSSGKTASLTLSGGTISSTVGAGGVLSAATNATISGMTITQTNAGSVVGIDVNAATGVTISNTTLTQTSTGGNATGINVRNSSTVTMSSNTITSTATAGTAAAVFLQSSSTTTLSSNTVSAVSGGGGTATALTVTSATATVSGNTLSATSGATNTHTSLSTATINAGSTGNTATPAAGGCTSNAAGSGSDITYTNAANCSPD